MHGIARVTHGGLTADMVMAASLSSHGSIAFGGGNRLGPAELGRGGTPPGRETILEGVLPVAPSRALASRTDGGTDGSPAGLRLIALIFSAPKKSGKFNI